MSLLIPGRKGNPNWGKGKSGNPDGRPRIGRTNGVKRTLAKLKRNPVEELISLADHCKVEKKYDKAIEIWEKLYDDSFDSGTPEEKPKKSAQQILEEMEKDEPREGSSDKAELGDGETKATS